MSRRPHNFSKKVRAKAFQRTGGRCAMCGVKLTGGNIEYDHRVPVANGGESTVENCDPLCKTCHRVKTSGEDMPRIAKARRVAAKHINATDTRNPLPGGRNSRWKKTIGGKVVPRFDEGIEE